MTNDSDNTFIKPIQKKPTAHLPVLASSPATAVDYDPIQRLNEQLSRLNETYQKVAGELAALKERQNQMNNRPQAATLSQVEALANQPRTVNLNAEKFAHYVQPALIASLPSSEQLQAAAQAGADAIREAGLTAADQIQQAGINAASRVEQATVRSQNRVLGWLGFASWKHAVWLAGIPLILAGCGLAAWSTEYEKRKEQDKVLKSWNDFGVWVRKEHEAVWKGYDGNK